MKQLDAPILDQNQLKALRRIKEQVLQHFELENIIIFGSAARGELDDESDIDLLILTKKPVDRMSRYLITDIVFSVNLEYGTNFSTLVTDVGNWQEGMISVLPIKKEIMRDGVVFQ